MDSTNGDPQLFHKARPISRNELHAAVTDDVFSNFKVPEDVVKNQFCCFECSGETREKDEAQGIEKPVMISVFPMHSGRSVGKSMVMWDMGTVA